MSEKQTHTPGPWHYSEVIKGQDQYYRQIRADFKIAEVHACHSGVAGTKEGRAEDEANARLIAAAPEMYEQCKLFEEVLCELKVQSENCAYAEYAYHQLRENGIELDKLREVLAKVEGGEG